MADWTDALTSFLGGAGKWVGDNPALATSIGSEALGAAFGIPAMIQQQNIADQMRRLSRPVPPPTLPPQVQDMIARYARGGLAERGLVAGGEPRAEMASALAQNYLPYWQNAQALRALQLQGLGQAAPLFQNRWQPGAALGQGLMNQQLFRALQDLRTQNPSAAQPGIAGGSLTPEMQAWLSGTDTSSMGPAVTNPNALGDMTSADWDAVTANTANRFDTNFLNRGTFGSGD